MRNFYMLFILLFTIYDSFGQWKLCGPYTGRATKNTIKTIIRGDRLCMASGDEVFLSQKNGNYWINASNGIAPSTMISTIDYDGTKIIIGTQGNALIETQILLSSNNGTSYKQINNIVLPWDSRIMALSIHNDTILTSINAYNSNYNGVYYSIDLGNNWNKISTIPGYALDIARNDSFVFATTEQGVYRSANNGLDWEYSGLKNYYFYSVAVNGNDVYVANGSNTEGELFMSSDNGRSWELLSNQTCMNWNYGTSLAVDKYKNIYMIRGSYLMKSIDNGKTWNSIYNLMFPNSVAVDGDYVYVDNTSSGVSVSSDNGKTWLKDYQFYTLKNYALSYFNSKIYAGTSNGLFKSSDEGGSWNNAFDDFFENWKVRKSIITNGSSIIVGGYGEVLFSSIKDSNWVSADFNINTNTIPAVSSIAVKENIGYAGLEGAGLYYSNDGFRKWKPFNSGLDSKTINSLLIINNQVFAATDNMGLYKSNLNENEWFQLTMWPFDTCVKTLASNLKYIFIGTKSNGVFRSNDLGKSWIQVNDGLSSFNINSLYTCGDNIFAGSINEGIFMSNNNGENWFSINYDLVNLNINSIVTSDSNLFVGTDAGVWGKPINQFPMVLSFKELNIDKTELTYGDSTIISVAAIGGKPPYKYLWSNGSVSPKIILKPETTLYVNVKVTDKELNEIDTSFLISISSTFTPLVSSKQNIKIYPNPAYDKIFIESDDNSKKYLIIYNSNGSVLKEQELTDFKTQVKLDYNIPKGVYLLKIIDDKKSNFFKLFKF